MSNGDILLECDPFSPVQYSYPITRRLHREHSGKQEIEVVESTHFGRMLLLDGVVQLTERDEFFYHELLVHVPLHAHDSPRRVLIVGGGDGGSLREVLKHSTVEEVTLVEYDQRVIEVSRAFLPALSVGFDDPRARVVIEDGVEFLRSVREPFDVIVVDSNAPVGAAQGLYSTPFLQRASEALSASGMLVVQSESLHFHMDFIVEFQRRLREVFPIADLYSPALATLSPKRST